MSRLDFKIKFQKVNYDNYNAVRSEMYVDRLFLSFSYIGTFTYYIYIIFMPLIKTIPFVSLYFSLIAHKITLEVFYVFFSFFCRSFMHRLIFIANKRVIFCFFYKFYSTRFNKCFFFFFFQIILS